MTTSATTTRKAKGQRRGRPLGGGRRAEKQADDPVLRAVEQMVEAPDFPWPGGILDKIRGLVQSGIRVVPHPIALEAEQCRFGANEILGLAWQWKDGEINDVELGAKLGKALSSFREFQEKQVRQQMKRRGFGERLTLVTDDELVRFHVWREAEEDRKRVCPALPKDELRSVLAALCTRDWTRKQQWLRLESLRRWLAMSPEAIRHAAGSGRWKTDIAPECPESRKHGRGGRPSHLLGPRAAARVLRAYAAAGGELGKEAREAASVLERISRGQLRSGCCPKIPPSKSQ